MKKPGALARRLGGALALMEVTKTREEIEVKVEDQARGE